MTKHKTPKNILITGCSSGFGLLTAARLASHGHQVIATMRDLKKKSGLLNEVNKRGGEVDVVALDVTSKKSIDKAFQDIASKYGYLDVVVNNAGYAVGGFFEDLSDDQIRELMETNFFGVLNVSRKAIPLMRQRSNAKIINISSVAGFSSTPGFSAYNSSKWALEGFSESLYYELKPFDIHVCLIEPGTYPTKIFYENRKYATHFDNTSSPYYTRSQYLRNRVNAYVNDCYKDPEEIGILIEKIMHSKHPAFRYIPDIETKTVAFLRKVLPIRVYMKLIDFVLFRNFSENT